MIEKLSNAAKVIYLGVAKLRHLSWADFEELLPPPSCQTSYSATPCCLSDMGPSELMSRYCGAFSYPLGHQPRHGLRAQDQQSGSLPCQDDIDHLDVPFRGAPRQLYAVLVCRRRILLQALTHTPMRGRSDHDNWTPRRGLWEAEALLFAKSKQGKPD
jgi:hypothetical protein